MPRVSVIMAVHNGERFLREAIESILHQTFRDFEFVIIDDGSTDGSPAIVQSYEDERIRVLRNERNLGLTPTLNRGIAAATGDLIARQDGDDIAAPERLALQVAYLDAHPEVGLVGSWYRDIDPDGAMLGDRQLPCDPVGIRWALLFYCPFAHSAVMLRRSVFTTVGGYDEALRYAADREMWTRVTRRFPAANLPEYLLRYRVNPWSMTATYDERRFEGPQVSIASIRRLLHWPDAQDLAMERFRRLEALVSGSVSAIEPEWVDSTIGELMRLHRLFSADLALPAAEERRRREVVRRDAASRLVRAAAWRTRQGEHDAARRLLESAWRLRWQSAFTWHSIRAITFMIGRRAG